MATIEDVRKTLTLPEAAKLLGIGQTSAYALAQRGEFPVRVLQLGRKKLVSRVELERYLDGEADREEARVS